MVGKKCVLMKKQCILEVFEQYSFQVEKNNNPTNQIHPLDPLLVWRYLWASIWPPTYQSCFGIYFWCWTSALLQWNFFPKLLVLQVLSVPTALWLVGRWCEHSKRKWDENPSQMWAGTLLKASSRLDVLKDIWGPYKGIHQVSKFIMNVCLWTPITWPFSQPCKQVISACPQLLELGCGC